MVTYEPKWSQRSDGKFHGALVFLDEATRTRFNSSQMRTANTPRLATRLNKARDPDLVFAHALVGPSDLLVGVTGDSFKGLVGTIQTRIRKNVDKHNFIHRVQAHIIVSIEGRIDFSKKALDKKRGSMRAWILATASNPSPKNTSALAKALKADHHVKLLANVVGRYDYFIFVEAADMKDMQSVLDGCIRNRRELIATDTRIVMHE